MVVVLGELSKSEEQKDKKAKNHYDFVEASDSTCSENLLLRADHGQDRFYVRLQPETRAANCPVHGHGRVEDGR